MNQSLTVVLPIHNAESTLRRSVDRVLEVSSELTPDVKLLIIDDGSTDDSYDVAREIAAEFPQVQAVRQTQRRGLGPTIRNARRRVSSDVVMVHDGVSSMNAEQLRVLWERRVDPAQPRDVSMADLLRPKQNQAAMAAAHRRLTGFHLLSASEDGDASSEEAREAQPAKSPAAAVGAIPSLPKPSMLGALGDFARGE